MKQYYQSQVFADSPLAVIEIHGHVRGNHDIEVSTGFALKRGVRQDQALISALKAFQKSLHHALSKASLFSDDPPTVGIYPLDDEVRFTAKGTHTFNKIEKIRELGVNVSGLHIELSKRLRTSASGDGRICEAINECLATAISQFIANVKRPDDFDTKAHLFDDFAADRADAALLSESRFELQQIPRELVGEDVAVFCRRDMRKIEIKEGDRVAVSAQPDMVGNLALRVAESDTIQHLHIGIAKKFREKLGLMSGEKVFVGKRKMADLDGFVLGVVTDVGASLQENQVGVSKSLIDDLRSAGDPSAIALTSSPERETEVSANELGGLPHDKALNLAEGVAQALDVTSGDLVCFVSPAPPVQSDRKWQALMDQPSDDNGGDEPLSDPDVEK
ncbi:hypothetical protein ACFLSJ_08840 [Verrucomicrobiota bacterium]